MQLQDFPLDGHACPLYFGSCKCAFVTVCGYYDCTQTMIDLDNRDVRLTVLKKQTHTPTAKLFTPGERALRRPLMCHQNLRVCYSMTSLGRASSVKHTKSTQVRPVVITATN